jgi:hypothetical protein
MTSGQGADPAAPRAAVRVSECERLILAAMPRGVEMTHREVKASVPGLENATIHAIGQAFASLETRGQCERAYRNSTYYVTLSAGEYAPEPEIKMAAGQEPDPAAAYLAGARDRWSTADTMTWHDYATALELLAKALRSLADVPRLLKAVEAALTVHRRRDNPRMITGEDAHCGACGHEWPCTNYRAARKAIAEALTGEEPADGK